MTFTYSLRIAELGCRPVDREVFSWRIKRAYGEVLPLSGLIEPVTYTKAGKYGMYTIPCIVVYIHQL